MAKLVDMTGQVFGRLTVLRRAGGNIDNKARWHCRCACGNEVIAVGRDIRRGDRRSCGCLFTEMMQHRNARHAGKGTRLYNIWNGMHKRCRHNPRYANRVKVDDRWLDFEAFRTWALANGYQHHLTIDRKDTRGHYTPENCRWATWKQQRANCINMKGGYVPAE